MEANNYGGPLYHFTNEWDVLRELRLVTSSSLRSGREMGVSATAGSYGTLNYISLSRDPMFNTVNRRLCIRLKLSYDRMLSSAGRGARIVPVSYTAADKTYDHRGTYVDRLSQSEERLFTHRSRVDISKALLSVDVCGGIETESRSGMDVSEWADPVELLTGPASSGMDSVSVKRALSAIGQAYKAIRFMETIGVPFRLYYDMESFRKVGSARYYDTMDSFRARVEPVLDMVYDSWEDESVRDIASGILDGSASGPDRSWAQEEWRKEGISRAKKVMAGALAVMDRMGVDVSMFDRKVMDALRAGRTYRTVYENPERFRDHYSQGIGDSTQADMFARKLAPRFMRLFNDTLSKRLRSARKSSESDRKPWDGQDITGAHPDPKHLGEVIGGL